MRQAVFQMRGWVEGAVLGSVPNFCLLAPYSVKPGVTVCHSILAPVLSFTHILQTANPFQSHLAYECPWELLSTDKLKVCALFLTPHLALYSWILSIFINPVLLAAQLFLHHIPTPQSTPLFACIRVLANSILAHTLWLVPVFLTKMFIKILCPR